jgi:FkbH-like protein
MHTRSHNTGTISVDPKTVLKTARTFRKEGKLEDALSYLFEVLRRDLLGAEDFDKAGRFILKSVDALNKDHMDLRILILGQCTVSWLSSSLIAAAWARNILLTVEEGEYDNIFQDLNRLSADPADIDFVVLVPWNHRLTSDDQRTVEDRIEDEIAFWSQCWDFVKNRMSARLIQVGYDFITPGADGYQIGGKSGGGLDLIRQMNAALLSNLPGGAYFVDLERVSGEMGRQRFYNFRRYFWTKQPFSERGTKRLAEHIFAGIRTLTTGPKKVLVLDLDNTLWGGVVGELGPYDIALGESPDGEAYRAFQEHVKALTKQGTLLAVCSKNNPPDAKEPFVKNSDMVLSLSDFAAFEAGWDFKTVMLERIAASLNLGMDSFVYFDDHPAEREQVRSALPQVEVVDVSADPSDYISDLNRGLWFETLSLTRDDRKRAEQYHIEGQRRQLKQTIKSTDDYLSSLDMAGDVRALEQSDMQRVVQLLAKTNQFNLTTRRHSLHDVQTFLKHKGVIALTLRVQDRFGDYGLIGLIVGLPQKNIPEPTVHIDTWLMSCRVIGRSVEQFMFHRLVESAKAAGYQKMTAEYIPTQKNQLVAGFYENLGFAVVSISPDKTVRYELLLDDPVLPQTFVKSVK